MKKVIMLLLVSIVIFAAFAGTGCSKPKFSGTFEGVLPCADCPGLQTSITIKADGTFRMEEIYLERSEGTFISEGTWVLNKGLITFTTEGYSFIYKIMSDNEIRWAPNGELITDTDLNWSLFRK